MMERVELLILLLMLILSLYNLRVESEDGLFVGKLQRGCIAEEREALLNFKQNIFDPQFHLSNWDISEDCCDWKGVGCSNTTGHVIKIDLHWFEINFNATSLASSLLRLQHLQYLCLSGIYFDHTSIFQSIFSLTNLRYLDLSFSSSDGVISLQFRNMTNLRHLDLSFSTYVKVIAMGIGNLKNLQYLDLSNLELVGVIPSYLGNLTNLRHLSLYYSYLDVSNLMWISHLSSLQYLDMSYVNLTLATNWLHEIMMLPSLSTLYLSHCNLQTFPNLLPYSNLSSTIKFIDLSENQFSNSTILSWISNMTNLIELDLHDCHLYGNVPNNLLGAHYVLRKMDLSKNYISGTLTSMVLGQQHQYITRYELKYLDFSNNYLTGTLQTLFEQFRSLKTLYLQSNNFIGSISCTSLSLLCDLDIFNLSENNVIELTDDESTSSCSEYKMTEMDISRNQLRGSIPMSIGKMRYLRYLHLENNQLSGFIPQSLCQLMNLKYLNLDNNLLQDSLSDASFENLSQLKTLKLSNNYLDFNKTNFNWVPPFQVIDLSLKSCYIGPHFPMWLQTQKFLYSLDLSNGGISDTIPSWFWNISSGIYYLNMSYNAIRGELPRLLNIDSTIIDMGSNLLEGNLPQLMGGFLEFVSFSDNKFSNGIEWYLNANMSLYMLDLSENQFSDEIPSSICQMSIIGLLDLSYNNLWGEIPRCQGNISSSMDLFFINLANNNLWGSIPQWIGNLSWLMSLHMSNNSFQGDISYLKYCNTLITLDLGQNEFTGIIPLWIGDKLSSLKILCLRMNKFHGSIPSNLSKLKGLQILDLANNFLYGQLPKSFKFLKSMTIPNKSLESMFPSNEITFLNTTLTNTSFLDSLMINIKGTERKFTTILSLMMSMDLSCNNLSGEVSTELMSLAGLISLNLSKNQFTGQIPINIGVMKSLENLDLSWNHFSGIIPSVLPT